MMETPKLNHLALRVKNLEATKEFYLKVMGLELQEEGPGKSVMVKDNYGGIMGLVLSKQIVVSGLDHVGFTFSDLESFMNYKEKVKIELNKRKIAYEEKEHHDKSMSLFFNDINGYKMQIVYLPPDYFKQ